MIYVGLLGGASYVNIFYILLNNSKYPEKDRELCINIAALFITVGKYRILWTIGRYFFFSTRWLRPIVHIDLYKDEVKKIWNPSKKNR